MTDSTEFHPSFLFGVAPRFGNLSNTRRATCYSRSLLHFSGALDFDFDLTIMGGQPGPSQGGEQAPSATRYMTEQVDAHNKVKLISFCTDLKAVTVPYEEKLPYDKHKHNLSVSVYKNQRQP